MTSVTIEVDDELLARARQLAEVRKTTVAEVLQRMLHSVAPPLDRSDLPPLTRKALGMSRPMTDEEVERTLDEERMRKYGAR
jgi:hypothetical protein